VLSSYLAVRDALLTRQIDNSYVDGYERSTLAFRRAFAAWIIERTALAHPAVLTSLDVAEWDAELDRAAERARVVCIGVTAGVSVVAAWLLGPLWPAAAVASWLLCRRLMAVYCVRQVNATFSDNEWDVPALLADVPRALYQLQQDALAHRRRASDRSRPSAA